MLRLLPRTSVRRFSATAQNRSKKKDHLRVLEKFLQNCNLSDKPERTATELALGKSSTLMLDALTNQYMEELEDTLEILAFSSSEDVCIQANLDQGRRFGAYPYILNRSQLIRLLPDKINLDLTPWEEIEHVYSLLKRLDEDTSVQFKYNRNPTMTDLLTRFSTGNSLYKECRSVRRGEASIQRLHDRMLTQCYSYNVVGFDRTFLGLPIRSQRSIGNPDDPGAIPRELVEDIKPFSMEVVIHKKDANFIDKELASEIILPHDPKPGPPEVITSYYGRPLMLKDIYSYVSNNYTPKEVDAQIKEETSRMRKQLADELIRHLVPGSLSTHYYSQRFLPNEYVTASRHLQVSPEFGLRVMYLCREFGMIPIYGLLLSSQRDYMLLFRHICRVILTNLEYFTDMLLRLKYKLPDDMDRFSRRYISQVRNIVGMRIMPLILQNLLRAASPNSPAVRWLQLGTPLHAVTHKHVKDGVFLRLYWVRRPRRQIRSRGALRLTVVLFGEFIRAHQEAKREERLLSKAKL